MIVLPVPARAVKTTVCSPGVTPDRIFRRVFTWLSTPRNRSSVVAASPSTEIESLPRSLKRLVPR